MDNTLFRVLCRHLHTLWLRARNLFLSIRFRQLSTSSSTSSSSDHSIAPTRIYRPPTPMPTSDPSPASRIIPALSMARTKACQWASGHARRLKVQMEERRRTTREKKMVVMKQVMYARMGAAVGQEKEDMTMDEEEDDDEANEEEEEESREGTVPQGDGNLDAFEALFGPLSSSPPPLRLYTWPRSRPQYPPSLSVLSRASTPGPLTPALSAADAERDLCHGVPSPTLSCASSGSCDISAPATPTTPLGFPASRTVDQAASVTPRLHIRPHPRPRSRFRTLSASITARSPLSFSFPISLSLPLAARRASSPGAAMHRYMVDHDEQDGYSGEDRGRTRRVADRVAREDGEGVGEGEDPFGTHGREYYAPGARVALGLGNAYDLSAWAWACDYSPYRRTKKRKHRGRKRHYSVHAVPATDSTDTIAAPDTGGDGDSNIVGGTRSGRVYRSSIHAASAPQLSDTQNEDSELEYLCALTNATTRGRVVRPYAPVRRSVRDGASRYRSGIRPLLLPQKYGLQGSGALAEHEADKVDTLVSGGRESRATGWELDLERGACGERREEI